MGVVVVDFVVCVVLAREEPLTERAQRKVNERCRMCIRSRSVLERWRMSPAAPVSGGRRRTVVVDAVDVVTESRAGVGKKRRRLQQVAGSFKYCVGSSGGASGSSPH